MANGDPPPLWLSALAGLAVFGGGFAGWYWFDSRRRRRLKGFAKEHDWAYDDYGGAVPLPEAFAIVQPGWWRTHWRIRESLEGEIEGADAWVFELRRYRGGATDAERTLHGYPVLAALVQQPGLDLPFFAWWPSLWRCLTGKVATGEPLPEALRTAFETFTREHPRYNIEGLANQLLLYRRPRVFRWQRLHAGEAERLLAAAQNVSEQIQEGPSRPAS